MDVITVASAYSNLALKCPGLLELLTFEHLFLLVLLLMRGIDAINIDKYLLVIVFVQLQIRPNDKRA